MEYLSKGVTPSQLLTFLSADYGSSLDGYSLCHEKLPGSFCEEANTSEGEKGVGRSVIWFESSEPIGSVTLPEHAVLRIGIRPDYFRIHIHFPNAAEKVKIDVTLPVADIVAFCCKKGLLSPPASNYSVTLKMLSESDVSSKSEKDQEDASQNIELAMEKPLKIQLKSLSVTDMDAFSLVIRHDAKSHKRERSIVETLNAPPIYPEEPGVCVCMCACVCLCEEKEKEREKEREKQCDRERESLSFVLCFSFRIHFSLLSILPIFSFNRQTRRQHHIQCEGRRGDRECHMEQNNSNFDVTSSDPGRLSKRFSIHLSVFQSRYRSTGKTEGEIPRPFGNVLRRGKLHPHPRRRIFPFMD